MGFICRHRTRPTDHQRAEVHAPLPNCYHLRDLPCLTHSVIDNFWFGSILSLVTFLWWLSNRIITMHAESSWAINTIGDIKMANLYFFS